MPKWSQNIKKNLFNFNTILINFDGLCNLLYIFITEMCLQLFEPFWTLLLCQSRESLKKIGGGGGGGAGVGKNKYAFVK